MTWAGVEQSGLFYVNAGGVPHHDSNYQGWYYRPWNRDAAWEYWRITSTGELEIHHFCTDSDGCTGTSPLGSSNFCCSGLTAGAESCDGGNNLFLN